MDLFHPIPAIPVAIATAFAFSLFLFSLLWLSKSVKNRDKKRAAPEAGSSWPVIGHLHLLRGPQPPHTVLGDMADKYGPIFTIRMGVYRALVVNNWETAKECLTTNDKAFASRPKTLAMEFLSYDHAMFGFTPYGQYWRQMRKVAALELLSSYRLDRLKHVRQSEIKTSLKELYRNWSENKDSSGKVLVEMKTWFRDVTLNVILRMIVGKRIPSSDSDAEGERWKDALQDFFDLFGKFVISDALPFLKWLDIGGDKRSMKKVRKELDEVAGGWLQDHKRKKASGNQESDQDFMDVMFSILSTDASKHDAETINKANCLAIVTAKENKIDIEAFTDFILKFLVLDVKLYVQFHYEMVYINLFAGLILAASDTTMVTLTWALSLLLNNRDALKKAQEELDIHVGRDKLVEESDVKKLVYLQAIVKETLRLYPAGPLSVPHESMEDCTVSGYRIPAGTRLLINLYKIHRDPRVWSDPCEFQPERFLTTYKDFDVRGQNFELIPFGSGRRMCPGVSFALQVLELTLANLLQGFELGTPLDEPVDMSEAIGMTNLKASPLEVLITPRLPAVCY